MKYLAALCVLFVTLGCDSHALKEGQQSIDHAGKAASLQWDSWRVQVQGLDLTTSKQKLEEVRKSLEKAQKELEKDPKVADAKVKLDEVTARLKQVDLALMTKDLQDKYDSTVKGAQKAGETAQDASKRLKEANDQFSDLEKKLQDAKKQYDDTAKKFTK